MKVVLDGKSLTIEQVHAVARNHAKVGIAPKSRDEVIKEVSAECHKQQAEASAAMIKNTEMLGHVAEVIRACGVFQPPPRK